MPSPLLSLSRRLPRYSQIKSLPRGICIHLPYRSILPTFRFVPVAPWTSRKASAPLSGLSPLRQRPVAEPPVRSRTTGRFPRNPFRTVGFSRIQSDLLRRYSLPTFLHSCIVPISPWTSRKASVPHSITRILPPPQ